MTTKNHSNVYLSDPETARASHAIERGLPRPPPISYTHHIDPSKMPAAGCSEPEAPTERPQAPRPPGTKRSTAAGLGYGRKHRNFAFYLGQQWETPPRGPIPYANLPMPAEAHAARESWARFERPGVVTMTTVNPFAVRILARGGQVPDNCSSLRFPTRRLIAQPKTARRATPADPPISSRANSSLFPSLMSTARAPGSRSGQSYHKSGALTARA